MFFERPTGVGVDPAHVPELDDAFFSSDPFGYFLSRIESIVTGPPTSPYIEGAGSGLCGRLGRTAEEMPRPSQSATELQRVVDAASLRHHLAETLVRMWLAVLETSSAVPGSESVWASLTDQPTAISDVLAAIGRHPQHADAQAVLKMLVPSEGLADVQPGSDFARAVDVLIDWFNHATALLLRNDVHLAASYNKVKHGLAIRARDDLRLDFIPFDKVAGDGSEIPLSAFTDAAPLIDRPCVLYLARPPRGPSGYKECLEMTWLRLDAPTLLAESFMLATVHAAVFHTAASRYQEWRKSEIGIPAYPRLATGPTPEQLVGRMVVGLRAPVTLRPDGRATDRKLGVAFSDGSFIPLDVTGPGRKGLVVD